jgi:hypothetical protein
MHAAWRWPDPGAFRSKLLQTAVEAGSFRISVSSVHEKNAMYADIFQMRVQQADIIPAFR